MSPPPPAVEGSVARAQWRTRGWARGLSPEGRRWERGEARSCTPPARRRQRRRLAATEFVTPVGEAAPRLCGSGKRSARAFPSGAPAPERPHGGHRAHKVELRASWAVGVERHGGPQGAGVGCAVGRGEGHWMWRLISGARGLGLAGNFCSVWERGGGGRKLREGLVTWVACQFVPPCKIPGRRGRIPVAGRTGLQGLYFK